MRLLIFTNHFHPESFRINDIAFEMCRRGHDVKVITGIPDYPQGKFHEGYSLFRKRRETVNGVKIIRYPVIPRGKAGAARMALQYLSGIISGYIYGLWQGLFGKFDCVFVHDTSPAFINLGAQMAARMKSVPVYHWVLDLWPESLVAGGISGGKVYSVVDSMMRRVFRRDTKIMVSSRSIGKLIAERGVYPTKISYLPNWSDKVENNGCVSLPPLPSGFILMFAGNIGEAQNMENLLKAANLTKERKDIHWVFVGDGRKKAWADAYVVENGLSDTVHMVGRYPIEAMPSFFAKADAMVVSLSDTPIFNITVPAKLQAYMAASKPVFAVMKGEGAQIVAEAECGWITDPASPEDIAAKAIEIAGLTKEKLEEAGRKSGEFYSRNFDRAICMDKVEEILNSSRRR